MIEQKFANVLMALGFEIVGDRESSAFSEGQVLGVRSSQELTRRHVCSVTTLLEDIRKGKTLLTVQGDAGV